MNKFLISLFGCLWLLTSGCVSLGKLARHDFDSGFYKLKVNGGKPARVYAEVVDDSVIVYPINNVGNREIPNISSSTGTKISRTKSDNYLYQSCFINNSLDIDLTTIIFKSRHSMDDVPNQFSADLDIALYLGIRKDFYKLVTPVHPIHEEKSYIRQIGYDFGIFAGIGSTPVNPTVTNNKINQEYDAMIFQKGFAAFISINKMSFGLALGFDNLLDKSRSSWIYNQKPYLGLIISVSSF